MTSSLFYHSTKHLLRLSIPNTLMRKGLASLALFLLLVAFVGGMLLGIYNPPEYDGGMRSIAYLNNLSGLFLLLTMAIMFLPTYFTIRGSLKLISHPETSTLMLISPISPVSRFWATLGPVIFFALIPYLVFFLPFVALFIFLDPVISLITLLYFVILSGWSVVLTFVSIMYMLNYFGKERTLRMAYSIPAFMLALPALFSFAAEEYRAVAPIVGHWQLIFFAISIAILPPLFMLTCKRFYSIISTSVDPVMEFNPPKWGVFNPWNYLDRKAMTWSMIPMTIVAGILILDLIRIDLIHESVIAVTIYTLITNPVYSILEEERNCPQRLLLAPFVHTFKKALWVKMILPLLIAGFSLLLWLGYTNLPWLLSVFGIMLLGTCLLTWRPVYTSVSAQKIMNVVIWVAIFSAQLLW